MGIYSWAPEIVVAVIDSGTNYQHEDLSDNIAPGGKNFIGTGSTQPPESLQMTYMILNTIDTEHMLLELL